MVNANCSRLQKSVSSIAYLCLVLERGDLGQSSDVPWSLAELGGEKGLDQIPRQFRSFDASAQTNQVEVVILDPLLGRKNGLQSDRHGRL